MSLDGDFILNILLVQQQFKRRETLGRANERHLEEPRRGTIQELVTVNGEAMETL